jgi:hypothetical protein
MTKHGSADRLAPLAVFAAAFAYLLAFHPFTRPLILDAATWDYMSVRLLDGMIPYRDVFLHKTPGAALIGAAGAAAARLFGFMPVHGAHLVYLVIGATGPALLYLLSVRHARPLVALAAAVFFLSFDQWPVAALEGVRPKVATTVLGLAALLAAGRARWRLAGAFGGAAVLCWQPGVAFLAGALWETSKLRRGERGHAVVGIATGAAFPAMALLAWLASVGALSDFFAQAVGFNLHYIDVQAKSPARTLVRIGHELAKWNRVEALLLPAALCGLVITHARVAGSLVVFAFGYGALAFVSFQAWPDTILFGPPLAAVLGVGLSGALGLFVGTRTAEAMVLGLALTAVAVPTSARLAPPITYEEQASAMAELGAHLDRDDSVIAISLPEFLLHTGRTSRWPWPYLWFGVDRFGADSREGGFDSLLRDLDADPPKLILIARRWSGALRKRFDEWAQTRYRRERVEIYPHTFRPIVVYRLRERAEH